MAYRLMTAVKSSLAPFGLYVLFSYIRPWDATLENCFFHVSPYPCDNSELKQRRF